MRVIIFITGVMNTLPRESWTLENIRVYKRSLGINTENQLNPAE